jgi:hypothetical protein
LCCPPMQMTLGENVSPCKKFLSFLSISLFIDMPLRF